MKKLLGIVVLGLLLSNYSQAATFKKILDKGPNYIITKEKRNWGKGEFYTFSNGLSVAEEYCSSKNLYSFYIIALLKDNAPQALEYSNMWPDFESGFGYSGKYRYFCAKTPEQALSYFNKNIPSNFKANISSDSKMVSVKSQVKEYIVKSGNSKIQAEIIKREEEKSKEEKKIAEKPKKQEPENIKINIHQVLLNQKLVINYEGKNWTLQFLTNGQIISDWDNHTHRNFKWKKINNNGLYDVYYKKEKKPNLYNIDLKNGVMKETSWRNNETFTHIILSPKYESLIAEKPKKKQKPKSTPDDDKIVPAGSGSGFFVSKDGHAITNYHVIEGCDINKLSFKGSQTEVKVLAVDKVNDIAILKSNAKPDVIFPVSNEDVSLLEDVIVAGFPLGKQISSAIKTHKGVVTALAGAGDNYSFFQTDAAINQGNSGGPIINQKGNVVGIAVATWVEEGVQGVHFGIKSSTLKTFASANGLNFASPNYRDLSNKDLGKLITKGTVYVECHMTVAKIKKMIAQAENRKAFFKEHK